MNKTQYEKITRSLTALGNELIRVEFQESRGIEALRPTPSLYSSFTNALLFLERKYHINFLIKGNNFKEVFIDFDDIEKNQNFEFWWIELVDIEKKFTKKLINYRKLQLNRFHNPTYYKRKV